MKRLITVFILIITGILINNCNSKVGNEKQIVGNINAEKIKVNEKDKLRSDEENEFSKKRESDCRNKCAFNDALCLFVCNTVDTRNIKN